VRTSGSLETLGDNVVTASAGDLVFKSRNQWHTFWNAGDEPARILEIIAPAGFERFFGELVDLGGVTQAKPQILDDLCPVRSAAGPWERAGSCQAFPSALSWRARSLDPKRHRTQLSYARHH
jgi:Cupin domain